MTRILQISADRIQADISAKIRSIRVIRVLFFILRTKILCLDVESLVPRVREDGDGAAFIHGFHQKYAPMSRYLLDCHHLCEKLKQRIYPLYENKNRRKAVIDTMLDYPRVRGDDVGGALDYIQKLLNRFRKRKKLYHLKKLAGYIRRSLRRDSQSTNQASRNEME